MIVLTQKDMQQAVTREDVIAAVEETFRIQDAEDYTMPPRIQMDLTKGQMLYMPCRAGDSIGTKILSQFSGNRDLGMPLLQGAMLVNHPANGSFQCLMDGTAITAMRTGAIGAVGAKYLSSPDADSVGLVGTGVQGLHQIIYIAAVRKLKTVYLFQFDPRPDKVFEEQLRQHIDPNTEIVWEKDIRRVMAGSQILVAATPSAEPVFPDEAELTEGKCFIGIGSWQRSQRELPNSVYALAGKVYLEFPQVAETCGDPADAIAEGVLTPDKLGLMKDVIAGREKGYIPGQTTCLKSVGMALYDTVTAAKIYAKAVENNIGTTIDF